MAVYRSWAVILLILGCGIAYFLYASHVNPEGRHFKYGLDLVGGTHLIYEADTAKLDAGEVDESMQALRDVIEKRINVFGVAEPIIQTERASALSDSANKERLIIELPGITNLDDAIAMIGATPLLEFKLVGTSTASGTEFIDTGLTGSLLTRARLEFQGGGMAGGLSNEPVTLVDFNDEGKELFAKITTENTGRQLAIFLDGKLVSDPVINEPITGGTAVISGNFTAESARELVRNLNIGALPVPITLASSETIGASLGKDILDKGVTAGLVGLLLVCVFMIAWYRLPGAISVVALMMYIVISFAVFILIPVTLSASGIAAFILSIGMAVDANVLIFERIKEELRKGVATREAARIGFARAWPAIRDGHLTMLISSTVLFWLGTSIVQGFALVFGLGVLISLFSAVSISRVLLLAILPEDGKGAWRTLMSSGIHIK